jgi:hypothetical protein
MNENIKKLIEQADIYCDQHWLGNPFYDVKWEEKFAELLIKECANINYNSPFPDGEFHAREVLYHFGVEE